MSEPRTRWDRQKGESRKAYADFLLYRDLGLTRSLAEVARRSSKHVTLMIRWNKRWDWVGRSDEWDAYEQRLADEALRRQIDERAERHARTADALLGVGIKILNRLNMQLDEVDAKGHPTQRVTPRAALLAVEAIKVGRLIMGEPTERMDGIPVLRIIIEDSSHVPTPVP